MALLVDTHCHLNLNSFEYDLPQVLDRARQSQLACIIVPGIDLETSIEAVHLCDTDSMLYAAVGIHPNDALKWNQDSKKDLRELASHPRVKAIGEIGLDLYRDTAPLSLQISVLREQLDLAQELDLPVILHCRKAMNELWPLLEDWHAGLARMNSPLAKQPGVLHSYESTLSQAMLAIEKHFYLGFNGSITYNGSSNRNENISQVNPEAILLETDSPFLSPDGKRGQRNEPANIPLICQKIADLRGTDFDLISHQSTQNATNLFHLDELN